MTPRSEHQPASPDGTAAARPARVVVITGASSGIGRATAQAFARRGDRVVLVARRADELDETLRRCGGAGRTFVADVADRAQVAALAASVREVEGRCDVLVNNAGIGSGTPFEGPDQLDVLERVIGVNLLAPAYATAELLALLRASTPSAIVNVSSVAGFVGTPRSPIYCASKFGLTGFSESLGAQLEGSSVRVATVQPGPVPTPGWPHERITRLPRPLRRVVAAEADDVARAIVRAADGDGSPWPIVPRTYRAIVVLKALAPPLYRMALRTAGRLRR